MTELELQQRGLLDLVKSRGIPPQDSYLRQVAGSPELALVREIAIWWRMFQLEVQCLFTSRLLKRRGCFAEIVTSYFDNNGTSAFIEELSHDFLRSLGTHVDPLIRSTAQFENAFLQARARSTGHFEILWDRHPDRVFAALEDNNELPPVEPGYLYRMKVDRDLPYTIACTREVIR